MFVSLQGSPLFELVKQEQEGGAAEQVETPASFSQPLQHNHTAADLWVRCPTFVCQLLLCSSWETFLRRKNPF